MCLFLVIGAENLPYSVEDMPQFQIHLIFASANKRQATLVNLSGQIKCFQPSSGPVDSLFYTWLVIHVSRTNYTYIFNIHCTSDTLVATVITQQGRFFLLLTKEWFGRKVVLKIFFLS